MRAISLATYLAAKEIIRNRARFLLVSMVIALITLLVLFIAGLGEGLGTANREYLSNLDVQWLVFAEKADFIIPSSRVEKSAMRAIRRIEGVADVGLVASSNTAILLPDGEVLKVSLIGVEPGSPGAPEVTAGSVLVSDQARDVVLDQNVLERSDLKLGDTITVRSTQGTKDQTYQLKVVGLTQGQSFTFQPSIFVSYSTWDRVRAKSDAELGRPSETVNVIPVKVKDPALAATVKQLIEEQIPGVALADIATAINNVPGYSAQQSTIQTQGVFTLLIGVLVIGGFFQIQILQKVPQIGVLKAIGASNAVVGAASVFQIIMVTALGVGIGGLLTFLFSLGFPPTVPIVFDGQAVLLAVVALLLIGPLGGMVSIIYAVRIEPLKALRLG